MDNHDDVLAQQLELEVFSVTKTLRDLSVMVSVRKVSEGLKAGSTSPAPIPSPATDSNSSTLHTPSCSSCCRIDVQGEHYMVCTHIVDLERKPLSNLHHYHELDSAIVSYFRHNAHRHHAGPDDIDDGGVG
eukprot:TRINITY_DN42809_c0_g1_i1.p1 TRINITY_DN42809_c0_g1~~TRINITY_DN42809_c0_g1_i1.p1  ORF type:complete len:143 (+),score=16.23 TRINITY_DN42809_c0_g1_i1:38-430(+)